MYYFSITRSLSFASTLFIVHRCVFACFNNVAVIILILSKIDSLFETIPLLSSHHDTMRAPPPSSLPPSSLPPSSSVEGNNDTNTPLSTSALPLPSTRAVLPHGMLQLSEQQKFLLFMKVALLYVKMYLSADQQVSIRKLVARCTQRNRVGDPAFTPLPSALGTRLRHALGPMHWLRVRRCFTEYCQSRRIRLSSSSLQTSSSLQAQQQLLHTEEEEDFGFSNVAPAA